MKGRVGREYVCGKRAKKQGGKEGGEEGLKEGQGEREGWGVFASGVTLSAGV